MSDIDNFLSKLSKESKFFDEPLKTDKNETQNKIKSEDKIDASLLFENGKQKSILDDLDITLTESEKEHFKTSKDNDLDDNRMFIRKILREELDRYFQDKFVIKESGDFETIIFKIGNSVFKGKLELLK